MNELNEMLNDLIAGHDPATLLPVIATACNGRAMLELDATKRRLWQNAGRAVARVLTREAIRRQGKETRRAGGAL